MAVYKWDQETKQLVKISDRLFRKPTGDGKSFKQQVLDGYRRIEERGERYYGKAENIKRIWA